MTTTLPNPKDDRIHVIDAFRGFALAGVAIAHMSEQYLAGPTPPGFLSGINTIPDFIVQGFNSIFISGKFFAIFSMLFGLSFFIQMEAAERKGKNFTKGFLWRAVLLFGIGYVHQLFYRGDILTIYAMLVPFLLPFYKLSNKWILIVAGICFLSIPRFLAFGIFGSSPLFGLPDGLQNPLEEAYYNIVKYGTIIDVFEQNAVFGMKTKMAFQLQYFGRFYYTFGYFLIGLWLGKIGLFHKLEENKKKVKNVLFWSAISIIPIIGLVMLAFGTAPQPIDFTHWRHIIAINVFDYSNIAIATVITCGFLLLYLKPKWQHMLDFFRPYGRMALTNYLGQAIIGTGIYFGWGLGYLGELRTSLGFLLAIVIITIQTLFSKWWLSKFRYGPLEWLWRSGTYLKWQPFKRKSGEINSQSLA